MILNVYPTDVFSNNPDLVIKPSQPLLTLKNKALVNK